MRRSRYWLPITALLILLNTPPALGQTEPSLSVHATTDSLIIRIGSETLVVPRDALALLSSPEGYNRDALSLHVALLHGTLTVEDSPGDTELPLLTNSAPLSLTLADAVRSAGTSGHTWEDVILADEAVVQMLPDVRASVGQEEAPRLVWSIEVADTGSYYFYVRAAGINAGNTAWVGTPGNLSALTLRKNGQLEWVQVGPITLQEGVREVEIRGRQDGAYASALVLSRQGNLSPSDLDGAMAARGASPLAFSQESALQSAPRGTSIPDVFSFHPVYPNPTRGEATATVDLPDAAEVRIEVYDTLGRRLGEQVTSLQPGFGHAIPIETDALASGVYIVRVTAQMADGDTADAQRLTVVR